MPAKVPSKSESREAVEGMVRWRRSRLLLPYEPNLDEPVQSQSQAENHCATDDAMSPAKHPGSEVNSISRLDWQ